MIKQILSWSAFSFIKSTLATLADGHPVSSLQKSMTTNQRTDIGDDQVSGSLLFLERVWIERSPQFSDVAVGLVSLIQFALTHAKLVFIDLLLLLFLLIFNRDEGKIRRLDVPHGDVVKFDQLRHVRSPNALTSWHCPSSFDHLPSGGFSSKAELLIHSRSVQSALCL